MCRRRLSICSVARTELSLLSAGPHNGASRRVSRNHMNDFTIHGLKPWMRRALVTRLRIQSLVRPHGQTTVRFLWDRGDYAGTVRPFELR